MTKSTAPALTHLEALNAAISALERHTPVTSDGERGRLMQALYASRDQKLGFDAIPADWDDAKKEQTLEGLSEMLSDRNSREVLHDYVHSHTALDWEQEAEVLSDEEQEAFHDSED